MSNYYEKKYQALSQTHSHPLNQIVEVLLYQSTPPKLPENSNKFQVFWQSGFIAGIQPIHLRNLNYRIAFAQYLRYCNIDDKLCQHIADICPESFVLSIRKSGIIGNIQHKNWQALAKLCQASPHDELRAFIMVAEHLRQEYEQRLNAYNTLKQTINLSQLGIMIYSSLYTYEYLFPEPVSEIDGISIPYQIDPSCPITMSDLWEAFDTIIRQTAATKNTVTEKNLALILRNKLMPFLSGEGMTPLLLQEYEQFKDLVALRVEIDLYKNFVFNAFSYQEETTYSLCDGQLHLNKASKQDTNENFYEKFSIIRSYWQWRGLQECQETPYFLRLDRGKNVEGNSIALCETQAVILRLQEVFGIYDHISNQNRFALFDAVLFIMLSQQFYLHDFVNKLSAMRKNGISPFESLLLLLIDGLSIGENRFPIIFSEKKRKAERMSSWILSGNAAEKKKSAAAILDFWSQNLREINSGSFQELPYYQIDNIVLSLPHRFATQNLHTAVINHFRKLNKNRVSLHQETNRMEIQLVDLFKKHGWQVLVQHHPEDKEAGEIDLIVIANNHVLVIELKSSFIKQNIREIYEYRYFALGKAAYQLSRKCAYVQETLLPRLGYDTKQISLHSWIVDTTLEFDHQHINGHLKISLEEMLIHLNQHIHFADHFFAPERVKEFNGIDFPEFIQNIEQDNFWKTELAHFSERMEDLEKRYSA